MMRRTAHALLSAAVLLGIAGADARARADGRRIPYQGRLTGVAPGDVRAIDARIYASSEGDGTLLWGPERQQVTVASDGSFAMVLGASGFDQRDASGNQGPDGVPDLDELNPTVSLFLDITVIKQNTEVLHLLPRQQVVPAFHATTASTVLDNAITSSSQIKPGTITGNNMAIGAAGITGQNVVNHSITGSDIANDGTNGIQSDNINDRQVTVAKLEQAAQQALIPVGTILDYGGTQPPPGFLMCDGHPYSKQTYNQLFGVIQYSFGGSGDTFNVPDFRGRFARGWDDTAGNDPDAASRTPSNPGGNAGDMIGSFQADQFRSHAHTFSTWMGLATNPRPLNGGAGGYGGSYPTDAAGGNETRPVNVSVNRIIKY